MMEEVLVTARNNPSVDPSLAIWSWDVAVYLFLGGVTAGILCFAGLMILLKKDEETPFAVKRLVLWAPILLSVGMGALFLDLEHKLYVFRFYTSLQISSPMSWGSWILVLVYPVSILLILCHVREGYPRLAALIDRYPAGQRLTGLACRWRMPIAAASVIAGVFLGFYTGILLSAFSARPFWNTSLLAPLFLISGLSSAAAIVALGARSHGERVFFTKIDVSLITAELAIIALLLVGLSTGAGEQLEALALVMGGPYALEFWVYFITLGLLVPVVLNYLEVIGVGVWRLAAPVLVLYGGIMLRLVVLELGQESTWVEYANQYSPHLLDVLR
ncbi:MAG: polysulfide reductase NrfD [Chromatiales bacterium]|jgi:formate-dependent nitrite reductase membrane component NrfD